MTDALWTSTELANALNVQPSAAFTANGVTIDSRSVVPGDLFIALAGPSHDGHDFVAEAFAKGAAAAIVHQDVTTTGPILRVADTLEALTAMGRKGRDRATNTQVIGITGSVGKTGTKDMLGTILANQGKTHISQGSHNNHWGVPLTLARLPQDAAFAVQEMGMNHTGELRELSAITQPHVAVITTVGSAHLEFFTDLSAIVAAKCEVFEGLQPNGSAILNRDHAFFGTMEKAARDAGAANIITFGQAEDADLRLISARVIALRTEVEAKIGGMPVGFSLPFLGRHWAMNALAALGAAMAAGANPAHAIDTLETLTVPVGRGALHEVPLGDGAFVLIDESYNANPQSMDAALATLAAVAGIRQTYNFGRAIAVLGDMFELGPTSRALHTQLATTFKAREIDRLFTCGELMETAFNAAPTTMQACHAATADDLIAPLVAEIRPGDVVMIKGSNGMRMSRLVAALTQPETFTKFL